jgi:hypothetical protein
MEGRRNRSRAACGSLALTLALALPVVAWPQEEPAAAPSPEEQTWLDASHRFLSRGFLWAVLGFDRIFADERDLDLPRTRSFFRWRNTLTIGDDGTRSYAPDLLAEAVLPNLDRRMERLRLRFELSTVRPETVDPLLPATLHSPDVPNRPYAGLVLSPIVSPRTQVDIQTGILLHGLRRPPGWYARTRLRNVQPIGDVLVARLVLAGFWQTGLGFGTRQSLSLDHPLASWLLLRGSSGSMVAERSRGWEWSNELAILAAAWPRTALSLSGAALGASQAGPGVEVWRLQARARREVYRKWVFLELAPEIAWTRVTQGHRQRASAVLLRLELQFDAATSLPPPRDRS